MKYVSIGMDVIDRIDNVRSQAKKYGFKLGKSVFQSYIENGYSDNIALQPDENRLPVYAFDAVIFTGTLDQVENFFRGIEWSRSYDAMIGAMSDQRRQQYEDKEVARLAKIKYNKDKAKTFKILKEDQT